MSHVSDEAPIHIDLPEDRSSSVLLLGVTRIPTSPLPARRPSSLPLNPPKSAQTRRTSFSNRRRPQNSSKRRLDDDGKCSVAAPESAGPVMDRSVDSIGACSLDVEASAELSDWSEASSGGTLRSANSLRTTPSAEPHLPSYLSLACTVNGYSTTTNYDPIRLARSRDASPHRHDPLTPKNNTYSIQNNLLSPPNLVPLPTKHIINSNKVKKMSSDHLSTTQHHLHHHQEFYTSTNIIEKKSSSSHFAATFNNKDTIDACFENGSHHHIKTQCVNSYEKSLISTTVNGQSNECTKEFSSTETNKSFIQQRVERLYGPGALAQGFFVSKHKTFNADNDNKSAKCEDTLMKASASSPALPVLRHLRPEFRAQLPIISPRKGKFDSLTGTSPSMQKSQTVPTLKQEAKLNGHKPIQVTASEGDNLAQSTIVEESGEKDGHYFLKILQHEASRLLKLAEQVEGELENEAGLSEEVVGKIRSASGKARLLVSQKMQQFKGLCTNNITQSEGEAFPTTNEDLQGFWDMVLLQVDQVDALFKEIDALKANNWQEIQSEVKSKVVTNGKPKKVVNRVRQTSAASEEARKQREVQRKQMIEERRKAMKAKNNKPVENIEIFVPESS